MNVPVAIMFISAFVFLGFMGFELLIFAALTDHKCRTPHPTISIRRYLCPICKEK